MMEGCWDYFPANFTYPFFNGIFIILLARGAFDDRFYNPVSVLEIISSCLLSAVVEVDGVFDEFLHLFQELLRFARTFDIARSYKSVFMTFSELVRVGSDFELVDLHDF